MHSRGNKAVDCARVSIRLTAADEWLVVGGHSRLASHAEPRQSRQVREIIVHPDFIGHTLHNDIALIRLDRPFHFGPNLRRICLPPADFIPLRYQRCYIGGWGKMSPDGLLSTVRRLIMYLVLSVCLYVKFCKQDISTSSQWTVRFDQLA